MAVEVETLLISLQAKMDRYDRDLAKAQGITNRRLNHMERRFDKFSHRIRNSASNAALGIRGALGGLGTYLSVRQVQGYADAWTRVNNAVKSGELIFGLRLRSARELNDLASGARGDLESFTKLYVRTAAATRELGSSEEDVAKATTTVTKALKLGGATAGEQASTMLQLSQALQKGKLDGDEFRAVMENAGVIQELLARRLNVTKGALIEMAREGKLGVADLMGALVDGADEIDRIFNEVMPTIAGSITVVNNALTEYVGNMDKTYGITRSTAGAMAFLARNMETVGDTVAVTGAALLAAFAPKILKSMALGVVGIGLAAGPIGLLAGAIGGASTALQVFGDDIHPVEGSIASLLDIWESLVAVVGEQMNPELERSAALWEDFSLRATEAMRDTTAATETETTKWMDLLKTVANAMLGVLVAMRESFTAIFTKLPQAIVEAMAKTLNTVVEFIERMINQSIDAINTLIDALNTLPKVSIDPIDMLSINRLPLGEFEGAGKRAGDAFGKAWAAVSRDYIGEIAALSGKVLSDAEQLALGRGFADNTTVDRPGKKGAARRGGASAGAGKKKAAKKNEFEREIAAIKARTAARLLDQQVIGMSEFAAAKLRAEADLLNAASKAGITLSADQRFQIDRLSTAFANAEVQTRHLQEAFEAMKETSKDVMKGFISDLREGKSGADALKGAIDTIADKLIDIAVNQLVDAAFGSLSAGGGAGGSAGVGAGLLSLFGFAQGGVMTAAGPRQLRKFARGGVSNQAAIFGEAGAEAAVPLPDGRSIPVTLTIPKMPEARPAGAGAAVDGRIKVEIEAGPEFDARVVRTSSDVVQAAAPAIVKTALGQTQKSLGRMIKQSQSRQL